MVWPTLGSKLAKEQNRLMMDLYAICRAIVWRFCTHSVVRRTWVTLTVNLLWRNQCWRHLVSEDIYRPQISCCSKTLTLLLVGASNLYLLHIQFIIQFRFSNFCKYSWLLLQLFTMMLHSDISRHFPLVPIFVLFDLAFSDHFYKWTAYADK